MLRTIANIWENVCGTVIQYLHAHYPMKDEQLRFEFVIVFFSFSLSVHVKIMVGVEKIFTVTQIIWKNKALCHQKYTSQMNKLKKYFFFHSPARHFSHKIGMLSMRKEDWGKVFLAIFSVVSVVKVVDFPYIRIY